MNKKTNNTQQQKKINRFIFWKKKERKKPETFQEKVIEFFRQLFFAAIAAFFIITFIIQNTRIPTGSMEDTILVGDFVLVNKFIYGSSSPKYIPFTEIELPFFRLPAFKEPQARQQLSAWFAQVSRSTTTSSRISKAQRPGSLSICD